jgi:hypothetical protein
MACLDDDAHTQEKLMRLPGTPDTEAPAQPDAALIRRTGFCQALCESGVRCALLAQDIVELILAGRQPPALTLNRLFGEIPMDWAEQRRMFGISEFQTARKRPRRARCGLGTLGHGDCLSASRREVDN